MKKVRKPQVDSRCTKICKALAAARAASGLSLSDVRNSCGMHPANISRIENCIVWPGLPVLVRLCEVYGVDPVKLAGGKKSRSKVSIQGRVTKNIHRLYAKSEYSYRELSEAMGIDPSFLNMLVAGDRSPSLESLVKVALGFGVEPHELLR